MNSSVFLTPSDDIQAVLDSIDYRESIRRPVQITLTPGDYVLTSPLVVTKSVIVNAVSAQIMIDHDGDGIVFGTKDLEPYGAEWFGGRITKKYGLSQSRGVVLNRANFVVLRKVRVDRFKVGLACEGYDPVDVTFKDCYPNGCEIGYRLVGSNKTYIEDGKITGDGTLYQNGIGIEVIDSGSVSISNVDLSILTGGAIKASGCTSLSINGIYTERIGPRTPLNNACVASFENCHQVELSGYVNAVGGAVGTNCDCQTGVKLTQCHGVVINAKFASCRTHEIWAKDCGGIIVDGSIAGNPRCPTFRPRVEYNQKQTQQIPLPDPTVDPKASWDGYTLTLNEHTQYALRFVVYGDFKAGSEYIINGVAKMIDKGPSSSDQADIRVRIGNGKDNAVTDMPMTVGIHSTIYAKWKPTQDFSKCEITLGSRANPVGQQVYANWSAIIQTISLSVVKE